MPDARLMQPRDFKSSAERPLFSYDWTDVVEGVGLIKFWGCEDQISGATAYNLLTEPIWTTGSRELSATTTAGSAYKFYTPVFSQPAIIDGTAYFSACVAITENDHGNVGVQLKLYRDGSAISNITSQVKSQVFTNPPAGGQMLFLKLDTTRTPIKIGDQIEVTVTIYEYDDGTIYMGFDPNNADSTNITPSTIDAITSQMLLWIPFDIDL